MSLGEKSVYRLTATSVAEALNTHLHQGLTSAEAQRRLAEHGPNELKERPRGGLLTMLWDQVNNYLVIILIVAAIVSIMLGEAVDAAAIMAIVVLNSILGVVQEYRAERALAALKKLAAPTAQVIRDGAQITVPARDLVPGDLVLLEAGNYVPADLRLVESANLKIQEASLTGESVPVDKNATVLLENEVPLGDRRNSAFMSTMVTYGRGKGLVTETGMHTEIGMIAEMIQSYDEENTPLQRKLNDLGRVLGTVALAICGLIFLIGIVRDTSPMEIFTRGFTVYLANHQRDIVELLMTAVSLAIAAVPEGLPAVVTICLALGMQRMVRRHALIRKLPAVETLGSATVVCSDKTGTLTQNQMTVVSGWAGGREFTVTGEGYEPRGSFFRQGEVLDVGSDPSVALLLRGAALCNDAHLDASGTTEGERTYRMVGDPTEGAMVVAAAKAGLWRHELEAAFPRLAEIPFDSERKRMTTFHAVPETGDQPSLLPGPVVALVKGAPDIVLQYCASCLEDGRLRPLTPALRNEIVTVVHSMAGQALRVLGLAYRSWPAVPDSPTPETVERELTFVGLLGMIDPARPEVKAAVALARKAGLKSIMVTGDYEDTATAIAREVGLLTPQGKVLTGARLDQLTQAEYEAVVDQVEVYARSSPQHKVRIVEALKARGHVVAMTGDGVNDAPALKRADIGVAMGITGTDVSKETADMVLTDDNFASIIAAIEEGRIIYSNIRKFVFYLISCNIGEILIIFLAMLAGLPIPLRPIQLLWLNLVTDGAPALALGLEKGDPDIMEQPPRPPHEPVINWEMRVGVVVQAVVMTAAVLGAFVWGLSRFPGHLGGAQTVAFATLVSSELLRAFTARSERHPVWSLGFFSNRWMLAAVGASFALLLMAIYVPVLQIFFDTVALGPNDWLVIAPFALAASVAAEITKTFLRRRSRTSGIAA